MVVYRSSHQGQGHPTVRMQGLAPHSALGQKAGGPLTRHALTPPPPLPSPRVYMCRESSCGACSLQPRMFPEPLQLCSHVSPTLVAQKVEKLTAVQEPQGRSLGREGPLEKGMAAHSGIFALKTPWTEEPAGLQSTESESQTRRSD